MQSFISIGSSVKEKLCLQDMDKRMNRQDDKAIPIYPSTLYCGGEGKWGGGGNYNVINLKHCVCYLHCSFWSLSLMVPRSGTAVADLDLCLSFFFCRFLAWTFSLSPAADSMKTCLSKSFN